ncbi:MULTISPECIES: hypothetical protein [unclassified Microbacterium]|uniref:hypothetical protein n=1 Tax=unclassified Microbacterium TaxID=2609290 RepID=UPI000492FC10|nr:MULTISPECIES: hypothetical protein [unclassified Microbacterium]
MNTDDLPAPATEANWSEEQGATGLSLKDRILEQLPVDGSLKPNAELLSALGADKQDFWSARELLVEEGKAVRGRGRGGSTARVLDAELTTEPVDEVGAEYAVPRQPEDALYEPLKKVLLGDWQSDKGFDYLAVEDVSRAGRRITGGKWTRPDLVAVEVQVFTYLPVKTLSVHTFEVKPSDMIDVTAVYEALAHRRAATHSYVLLHVPDDQQPPVALEGVITEARRHGIGVIVFADPSNYDTWEEKVVADRTEPEPAALDDFVRVQLPEAARSKIEKAVR